MAAVLPLPKLSKALACIFHLLQKKYGARRDIRKSTSACLRFPHRVHDHQWKTGPERTHEDHVSEDLAQCRMNERSLGDE